MGHDRKRTVQHELRDAEGRKEQLQKEAGGQAPTEQCKGCVDMNEAHLRNEGERHVDTGEPGDSKPVQPVCLFFDRNRFKSLIYRPSFYTRAYPFGGKTITRAHRP